MLNTTSSSKRTRSQLALPDQILQLPLARSPLKDARSALRNRSHRRRILTPEHGTVELDAEIEDDTDDEILLSPRKKRAKIANAPSKRPSSPRDEYAQDSDSDVGRDPKRFKRDPLPSLRLENLSDIENAHRPQTHNRNFSTPNRSDTRQKTPVHAFATSKRPVSSSAIPEGNNGNTNKAIPTPRAQSVPLFTKDGVRHINLKDVPPSPWRSPSKERLPKMKITVTPLDAIPDVVKSTTTHEGDDSTHTEGDSTRGFDLETPIEVEAGLMERDNGMDLDASVILPASVSPFDFAAIQSEPSSDQDHSPNATVATVPSTPQPSSSTLPPLSPLTPLLETPHPPSKMDALEHCSNVTVGPVEELVNRPKTPVDEGHIDSTNKVSMASASTTLVLPSAAPHPVISNGSKLPRPSMAPPAFPSTSKMSSLADILGPRTAAKIAPSSVTRPPSASVADLLRASVVPKIDPAANVPPKEKVKAKMRMREKPLSAFSFGTTGAGATGHVTRSVSLKKRARGRSGSIIARETPEGDMSRALNTAQSSTGHAAGSAFSTAAPPLESSVADPSHDTENAAMPEVTRKKSMPFSFAAPTSSSTAKVSTSITTNTTSHSNTAPMSTRSRPNPSDPGSPIKLSLPAKPKSIPQTSSHTSNPTSDTASTTVKSTSSANTKSSLASPTKSSLARAASTILPSSSSTTVSKPKTGRMLPPPLPPPPRGPSSLSNLANALEKLRIPHPVRPNSNSDVTSRPSTSMGFNRELGQGNEDDGERDVGTKGRTVDDGAVGRKGGRMNGIGIGLPEGGLRRAATMGSLGVRSLATDVDGSVVTGTSNASAPSETSHIPDTTSSTPSVSTAESETTLAEGPSGLSSSSTLAASSVTSSKNTLTSWITAGGSRTARAGPSVGEGSGANAKSRIFVTGTRAGGNQVRGIGAFRMGMGRGRVTQKVSRNPSLPSVMASPAKGGDKAGVANPEDEVMGVIRESEEDSQTADVLLNGGWSSENAGSGSVIVLGSIEKGKGKEGDLVANGWKWNASRRASLASQALSQSLSEMPPPPAKAGSGSMGPPAIPAGRGGARSASSSIANSNLNTGVRSSTRIMMARAGSRSVSDALGTAKDIAEGTSSSAKEGGGGGGVGSLGVMKDCTVFVDVRTDDGDDAGGLFVQMLRDMGAKILTRVGQTCTHIVYKNGLMSTLTRYRLLNDPKPEVVGIAWVVECVEQRRRVDEEKFKIDLEGVNVAGTNKRRRSMLPKYMPISSEPGHVSSCQMPVGDDGNQSMEGSSSVILNDLPPLEKARMRKGMLLGLR